MQDASTGYLEAIEENGNDLKRTYNAILDYQKNVVSFWGGLVIRFTSAENDVRIALGKSIARGLFKPLLWIAYISQDLKIQEEGLKSTIKNIEETEAETKRLDCQMRETEKLVEEVKHKGEAASFQKKLGEKEDQIQRLRISLEQLKRKLDDKSDTHARAVGSFIEAQNKLQERADREKEAYGASKNSIRYAPRDS